MRALVADGSAPAGIALHDVPEPVPASGEVLVDVRAFSLNRGELRMLRTAVDGWRPGWDFAGILASDADDGLRAGARVVGIRQGETWAERVAVPRDWIAGLPDGVSFAQGAALPTAGLAALRMLRLGPAILGRRVLVTGASGGVGRFAIQLAHLGGAEVTALVSSGSSRAEGVGQLGADEVVSDVGQLDGRFDLILESVGGDTLGRLVTMLDPQGTLVMFGNSSNEPTTFDVRDVTTAPSSVSRVSSCSSAATRSVVTSGTSHRSWRRAGSTPSSRASCPGAHARGDGAAAQPRRRRKDRPDAGRLSRCGSRGSRSRPDGGAVGRERTRIARSHVRGRGERPSPDRAIGVLTGSGMRQRPARRVNIGVPRAILGACRPIRGHWESIHRTRDPDAARRPGPRRLLRLRERLPRHGQRHRDLRRHPRASARLRHRHGDRVQLHRRVRRDGRGQDDRRRAGQRREHDAGDRRGGAHRRDRLEPAHLVARPAELEQPRADRRAPRRDDRRGGFDQLNLPGSGTRSWCRW